MQSIIISMQIIKRYINTTPEDTSHESIEVYHDDMSGQFIP